MPDNLPAGVTKAHRYEPIVSESYLDMVSHFGVAVVPARPYKPRDKAKVELAALLVERWILARLEQIGQDDFLLFSTDHPHRHASAAEDFLAVLPEGQRRGIEFDNAAVFLWLLKR